MASSDRTLLPEFNYEMVEWEPLPGIGYVSVQYCRMAIVQHNCPSGSHREVAGDLQYAHEL